MNVASLENCKRLYELRGWKNTDKWYWWMGELNDWPKPIKTVDTEFKSSKKNDLNKILGKHHYIPAYDSGYLLRKLPANIGEYRLTLLQYFTAKGKSLDGWQAYYGTSRSYLGLRYAQEADTPEDALCLLAITLFEGILK